MNDVKDVARCAQEAGAKVAALTGAERRTILVDLAKTLLGSGRLNIMAANALDLEAANQALAAGNLAAPLVDRLAVTETKLESLAHGLSQLAEANEVVGVRQMHRTLDDGLVLERVATPLGLLGVVFESRPDAVPQIAGLALKSGNAVVLKGGSEALNTNRALVDLIGNVLEQHSVPAAAVSLIEDRAQVRALLELKDTVDLIIARGSGKFVHYIQSNTEIPVMGHAEGLCHLYLHESALPDMAARIAVDGKCTYPAACNATETLLWSAGAEPALKGCIEALRSQSVSMVACEATRLVDGTLALATQADWATEWGDLRLSICRVDGLDGALRHIRRYGSGHTEVIVAQDHAACERFMNDVDAAGVFANASSRFADGYRYGLGAEVGISTGKLHARGPVGIEGLLTYKYKLRGHGHCTADYGSGGRDFLHRDEPL